MADDTTPEQGPQLTGADVIARLLERQGVDSLAGIPGGANLPLYDALARRGRIRHVLARHEQGAAFIAQGQARVSGRPGVCLASSGPAATNLVTALADAKADSVPLVCLTGQIARPLLGTDAFQEADVYGLALPVTKHCFLVESAAELLEVIPEAFRLAASGRPGPVLVDIPKDVQVAPVELERWPDPGWPEPAGAPRPLDIARAAALINRARRPLLYLGGGVIQAGAAQPVQRLAERAGIPAVATLMALGALPAEHPLALGMLGMHGARHTNLALAECDLLIAAGARFDDRATGRLESFCPEAEVVHLDVDPAELGKLRKPHAAVAGDLRLALEALLEVVRPAQREDWRARIDMLREAHPVAWAQADDPLTPYGAIRAVAERLGEDAIITTDVGQHQMWVAQAYPFRRPRRWLTSGGLGTMGFGLPAAIGAALAEPQAQVVCFSGDGSLLMNLQELATAAEEGLNVKVVLLNNGSLGLVDQQQELFYGGRSYQSRFRHAVDFATLARGFGLAAYDLGRMPPRTALDEALSQPGPALINVPIGAAERVFPMVPPGAANTTMLLEGKR